VGGKTYTPSIFPRRRRLYAHAPKELINKKLMSKDSDTQVCPDCMRENELAWIGRKYK